MKNKLPKSLSWTKRLFSRNFQFKDNKGKEVGSLRYNFFGNKITAQLNDCRVEFDIDGFIKKNVNITDNQGVPVGVIDLGFSEKATTTLQNGDVYEWKKGGFLLEDWTMIHDLPFTNNDPTVVSYKRVRSFLYNEGTLSVSPEATKGNENLIILIGFFIGFYFLRRRAAAAG